MSAVRSDDEFLMRALDLPPHLADVQNAYWQRQREWEELDRAYKTVVRDMLAISPSSESGAA